MPEQEQQPGQPAQNKQIPMDKIFAIYGQDCLMLRLGAKTLEEENIRLREELRKALAKK